MEAISFFAKETPFVASPLAIAAKKHKTRKKIYRG